MPMRWPAWYSIRCASPGEVSLFQALATALAVSLFAFSTLVARSYYGSKCWAYLLGENRILDIIFTLIFCSFVAIGATMNLGSVLEFSDSMIFAMSLANLAGLYILAPVIRAALRDYEARCLNKR